MRPAELGRGLLPHGTHSGADLGRQWPTIGTWDNKVYAFTSVNCITGKRASRLVQSRTAQRRKKIHSHTQRMQRTFACHLRDVGRVYPASHFPPGRGHHRQRPRHRGPRIEKALAQVPHVQLYRLPSYSPQLNAVERLWMLLRHRATHTRLFDHVAQLHAVLRKHLDWLQVHREPVRSVLESSL